MPACLYLLDEPHVQVEGRRFELSPAKPSFLLIYLAMRGEWVSRDALGALLWPDNSDDEARHNVRVNLHRAKNLPWVEGLEVERDRIRWLTLTDVSHFRSALGQADWKEAVRVHRRPFLEGFLLQDTPVLEEWASLEREGLLEAWRSAALRYSEALQQEQQHAQAATVLSELLRQDLLAEDILQSYLRMAYLSGQREAALKLYERFAQELESELGLEPMQETVELAQTLRRSQPLKATTEKPQTRIPLEVLKPPRLVGREAEQARLESAQTALVGGEPGVGKTRLLQEVFPNAPLIRCREGLENLPFYPVLEYLKAHLDALPELGPYREDLARLLPEVWPEFTPPPAESLSAKTRLLEALARALANSEQLLFDDLQWADEGTLELFLYLTNQGKRLMATYRTHEVGASLGKTLEALRSRGIEEIALQPLGSDSVQTLLADLIGTPEGPQRFSGWLHSKTGGNPFFALETLKALFENGVLRAEGGEWQTDLDEITQDYSELQIPAKVVEVVRRRVGRLSEPALRVVQAASVVQEGFTPKLLSSIIGLSEWAVVDAVEEAEQAGMFVGQRFMHDVLRQGIYQDLPQARCAAIHARVAEKIEAQPQVVAEHWFRAGETARAVELWLKGARGLSDLGLHAEAISLLERAHQHTIEPLLQARIRSLIAEQQHQLGGYERASEIIEQTLLQTLDVAIQAKLRALQLHILNDLGKVEGSQRIIDQLLGDVDTLTDPQLRRDVRWAISTVYGNMGKCHEALAMIQTDLEPLEQAGPSVALSDYLSSMGSTYDHLGQHEVALPYHQRAYGMAKALGARHIQVITVQNLIFCLAQLGRVEEGIAPAEHALSLGHFSRSDVLRNNLAAALQRLGRYEASVPHYEYLATHAPEPVWRAVSHARLAEAWANLGHSEWVKVALELALEHLTQTDLPFAQALVASRVLRFGSDDQIARIQPTIDRINLEALNPMVRAALEQAQADYAARIKSS